MDFEFKKNTLDGNYYCQCSMEHEIIGRWLQEEISNDLNQVEKVQALLKEARQNPTQELHLIGREITLQILGDEVIVQENALAMSEFEEVPEEFELYDSESIGCCGLEDFEQLIEQWREFIRR